MLSSGRLRGFARRSFSPADRLRRVDRHPFSFPVDSAESIQRDVAAGETAFAAIEDNLLALPADRLNAVTIDVQVAGTVVLAIANAIAADTVLRGRFEALAKAKEFAVADRGVARGGVEAGGG